MPKLSAGLLVYRVGPAKVVEVLIVHPGGPFWSKKDQGAWSLPKGEYAESEDPLAVAQREFKEELGLQPPEGPLIELGMVRQASGKQVTAWAVAGNLDIAEIKSNSFEMEWPPRSGQTQTFPEVDRADWFPIALARAKLISAQAELLDRLLTKLREQDPDFSEGLRDTIDPPQLF